MNQKTKLIIGLVVFALIIVGAVLVYNALRGQVSPDIRLTDQPGSISSTTGSETSQQDGDTPSETEQLKAPDFTVTDINGNSVKLSDMLGKPVVINFWASWCPPCKAEMPEFDTVYAELSDEITFMMIDLTDGQRETMSDGLKYITDQGFSFPIYFDTEQEAAYSYGIRSIPTSIFIDKDGYVVTGAEGQLDESTLRYGISLTQAG